MYTVDNVLNSPQPVQKPIPVMIGGGGEQRTLRYAARWADISHFFVGDVKSLKHKLGILKKHCTREGTDYDEIVKGTTFRVVLGSEAEINEKIEKRGKEYHFPTEPMKRRLGAGAGKTHEVADKLKELFDNELGLATLSFISSDDIPVFAKEVIPQLR